MAQNEIIGTEIDSNGFSITLAVGKFKALVMNKVKTNLAKVIKSLGITVLEVDEYLDVLSDSMKASINETLDEYGLTMPEFFITSVLTPDDDPNYRRLKQQFADKTLRVREEEIKKAEAEAAQARKLLEAQTEAQLKMVGAQGDAEAIKIKAQAEAEAYRAQAFAEADEMRAKGYTYAQESSRQVGLEAMKNGITGGNMGGGAGSFVGDIASLGITLGAMGGVMDMAKDAINPVMSSVKNINNQEAAPKGDTWDCECGQKGITSKFCPECGGKKPEPKETWDCECGQKGITSKFCPECGAKKPEPPATWDCPCGQKGITSKFCPECGSKKPEAPTTWDCPECGTSGINGKFCPECGCKRDA